LVEFGLVGRIGRRTLDTLEDSSVEEDTRLVDRDILDLVDTILGSLNLARVMKSVDSCARLSASGLLEEE